MVAIDVYLFIYLFLTKLIVFPASKLLLMPKLTTIWSSYSSLFCNLDAFDFD